MNDLNVQVPHSPDRLAELVAGQVLGDLSDNEQSELQALSQGDPQRHVRLRHELETVVSRTSLAFDRNNDVMPEPLRSQIRHDATRFFQGKQAALADAEQLYSADSTTTHASHRTVSAPRSFSLRETIAWVSCAAALLLALGLWNRTNRSVGDESFALARSELIASSDSLIQATWGPGKHPFGNEVTGDVVWDSDQQLGFMRFAGMPQNNPSQSQYQLWIIDPARDDEPVDGGVFDIDSSGEVIVPIRAKLQVIDPAAFAITVEKPGGVVVSTQENLPLLASVES